MSASPAVCPDPFRLGLTTFPFTPPYAAFLDRVAPHGLNSPYSPSRVRCFTPRSTHPIPIGARSGLLEQAASAMLQPNFSAHPQLSLAGALPIRPNAFPTVIRDRLLICHCPGRRLSFPIGSECYPSLEMTGGKVFTNSNATSLRSERFAGRILEARSNRETGRLRRAVNRPQSQRHGSLFNGHSDATARHFQV